MLLKMVTISHNKPIFDADSINVTNKKNSNIFKYFKQKYISVTHYIELSFGV